jgi:hypothetical protein
MMIKYKVHAAPTHKVPFTEKRTRVFLSDGREMEGLVKIVSYDEGGKHIVKFHQVVTNGESVLTVVTTASVDEIELIGFS